MINMTIEPNEEINFTVDRQAGTSDYEALTNKPSINNVELIGNKTTSDLGIVIPDVSGKLDADKVKSSYSTTSGDVYDVSYINSTLGDIESLLGGI